MAGEIIRPTALPDRPSPVASEKLPVDNGSNVGGATIKSIVEAGRPAASQLEAETGTNAEKAMTPLTTRQAIEAISISPAQRAEILTARDEAVSSASQASSSAGTATGAAGTAATSAGQAMSFRNQAQAARDEAVSVAPSTWQTLRDETVSARADAVAAEAATAADRVQTGLDAAATEASVVLAETARDSSFANAKGAAIIADARALVADTETFIVYAADALTFDAYRRTSSTTEVFLGTYPSSAVFAAPETFIGAKKVVGGFKDANDRFSIAVFEDGTVYVHGLELDDGVEPEPVTPLGLVNYGDSLSANGFSTYLAAASGGRSVIGQGIGGQVSKQIAARHGGLVLGVTVSGNQIVSGANSVTHFDGVEIASNVRDPTQLLSTPSNTTTRSLTVVIAGVLGTLTRTATADTEVYTFTPNVGQTVPVTCPPLTPMLIQNQSELGLIHVWWAGRNDADVPGWGSGGVEANIAAMANRMRIYGNNKFIVMGVINGNYASEFVGGERYVPVVTVNRNLAATYPDNFFDARRWLIDKGLAAVGITPTSQDLTDIGRDIVPASLRNDNIHLTIAATTALAVAVWAFISGKGW